jgi:hypothetical protein
VLKIYGNTTKCDALGFHTKLGEFADQEGPEGFGAFWEWKGVEGKIQFTDDTSYILEIEQKLEL